MADPAFWRDLRVQFESLADSRNFSRAFHIDTIDGSSTFVGGPSNELLQQSLHERFRNFCVRGGIATGASQEDAMEKWLQLLRARTPHWCRDSEVSHVVRGVRGVTTYWTLNDPAHASMELCEQLETAVVTPGARPIEANDATTISDTSALKKSRREFVGAKLLELNMSEVEWGKAAHPIVDYNTVRAYLNGKTRRLQTRTRTALARALNVAASTLPD
jgi:hypothetical protein